MRELEVDKKILINESPSLDQPLSWQSVLVQSLGKSEKQILTERAWGNLCQRMRDLCPETKWISIFEQSEKNDQRLIKSIQVWLETLVTTAEWPFPEQVILMSASDIDGSFRIIFNKNTTKLPYNIPPRAITVSPCRDEHTIGWRIFPVAPQNIKQIGHA